MHLQNTAYCYLASSARQILETERAKRKRLHESYKTKLLTIREHIDAISAAFTPRCCHGGCHGPCHCSGRWAVVDIASHRHHFTATVIAAATTAATWQPNSRACSSIDHPVTALTVSHNAHQ